MASSAHALELRLRITYELDDARRDALRLSDPEGMLFSNDAIATANCCPMHDLGPAPKLM